MLGCLGQSFIERPLCCFLKLGAFAESPDAELPGAEAEEDVYGDLYDESGEQLTLLKAKLAAVELAPSAAKQVYSRRLGFT